MEAIEGPEGIECYRLGDASGAELLISAHGGHAISWKTADGKEQLYLSPDADYSAEKAIRGGVPVIFPQFSDHGPFGRHGFARKSTWKPHLSEDAFSLVASPSTLAEWPSSFSLHLSFELSASSLCMSLSIVNPGETPFEFHAALHTYLAVENCTAASVVGLEGNSFLNEATGQREAAENQPVSFGREVDRAYFGVRENAVVLESTDHRIQIESIGFPDVVVWNPGPDHGIGDLPHDGWKSFVCVESALTEALHTLEPGETWTGKQILTTFSEP